MNWPYLQTSSWFYKSFTDICTKLLLARETVVDPWWLTKVATALSLVLSPGDPHTVIIPILLRFSPGDDTKLQRRFSISPLIFSNFHSKDCQHPCFWIMFAGWQVSSPGFRITSVAPLAPPPPLGRRQPLSRWWRWCCKVLIHLGEGEEAIVKFWYILVKAIVKFWYI